MHAQIVLQGLEFLKHDSQPLIYPVDAEVSNSDDNDDLYQPSLGENIPDDAPDPNDINITGVHDNAGYNMADNHNLDPKNKDNDETNDPNGDGVKIGGV